MKAICKFNLHLSIRIDVRQIRNKYHHQMWFRWDSEDRQ